MTPDLAAFQHVVITAMAAGVFVVAAVIVAAIVLGSRR